MFLRRLLNILVIVLIALSVPLITMQFTSEVDWQFMDFIIMGALLFIVAFLVDLLWRSLKNKKYRWITILVVIIIALLIWAELAVGIFGSPFSGS